MKKVRRAEGADVSTSAQHYERHRMLGEGEMTEGLGRWGINVEPQMSACRPFHHAQSCKSSRESKVVVKQNEQGDKD